MNQKLDITSEQEKLIIGMLNKYLPNCKAWVYGSRAKQTSTPKSDLDMVVFADKSQRLQISDLKEAFEDSNLPFCVDLFAWYEIPEQFRKNIEAEHIELYSS